MCGISGIIKKNGESVKTKDLKVMNDLIIHRGPDGEGYYTNNNIGFGHRRLAILDLSEMGKQPMKYSNDYIITYNGEVYNYLELREELLNLGYQFRSGTDTEVILASYEEWGEDCVHHFNGMWSFAILDQKNNKVFISRDRFGIKPLYYLENDLGFFWGSEIKQLLIHLPNKMANRQILFDYLYLGYHHHSDETFFEDVYAVNPGTNIVFDLNSNTYKKSRYYKLRVNKDYQNLSFSQGQELFEQTLDKAIILRLRSDVKVGTCLSGGLDSSYIATVASKAYNKQATSKFTAITAKSIEEKTDESEYAQIVSENANLNWKVTQPRTKDFIKIANEVIRIQEEPFGSPSIIMQYFVMEEAKKEGCTVMLDGQGGDEALLGYDRYFPAYLAQQKGILKTIKAFLNVAKNSRLSLFHLFLYNLYFNSATIRASRQKRRYHFVKKQYHQFLNKKLLQQVANSSRNIHELQENELNKVQLQKLLKYEDRNSMAHSIETRVPFVDYNVIELAYSLPFSYKMHDGWTKYILRKSGTDKLPDEILWRKVKFGFEAPTKVWLSDRELFLHNIKDSVFLGEFINLNKINDDIDDVSLWKLYNIAVWAKTFNVEF